jgi:UDP-N-acetylmuramoyl-L-alanyl-D-glutamate--2,6-diaminopimelate ligase
LKETNLLPQLTNPPQVTVEAAADLLLAAGNLVGSKSAARTTFGDIAYDSRRVTQNSAFICLPGEKTDGNLFIKDALALGASLIVTEKEPDSVTSEAAVLQVKDAREALAQLADLLYDHPSKKFRLIGVTGTNGKTTTTHLVEHIFSHCRRKIGLIGTLGARTNVGNEHSYTDMKHTTPQASDLQRLFFDMKNTGVDAVVMEVSSHALSLKRVAACNFSSICVTNLTQDHLDFHKDMESYFAAKRMLFEMLNDGSQSDRTSVVNRDDAWGLRFIEAVKSEEVRLLTYGWTSESDLFVKEAVFDFSGTKLLLSGLFGEVSIDLKLNGKFNVYNVMAALLLCTSEGLALKDCVEALEQFSGVAGRFESVSISKATGDRRQPLCLVDYAHTPDGLENVLKSARALLEGGRLIAVFGCGGDRDAGKRPKMGKIAEDLADVVIVTSDNPRSEVPQAIVDNILAGIKDRQKVQVEVDRASAINRAVEIANDNDIIVVAGKGHETYQILRDRTIDFDDRLVVKAALQNRLSR